MKHRSPISIQRCAELIYDQIDKSPYTAKQVMEGCGLSPTYLPRWKNGQLTAPTYIKLAEIAEFLNTPIELFIYGEISQVPEQSYLASLEAIRDIAQERIKKTEINSQ